MVVVDAGGWAVVAVVPLDDEDEPPLSFLDPELAAITMMMSTKANAIQKTGRLAKRFLPEGG